MIEFDYAVLNAGGNLSVKLVHLPVIPITVENNGKMFDALCLVDSGAQYCVLDAEIGRSLGLVIEEGERVSLSGVQEPRFSAYLHDITYRLDERSYPATIAFVDNAQMGYGILGRNGFFDYFKVCFDQRRKKVTFDPY